VQRKVTFQVDDNLEKSQKNNAVMEEKFLFRQNIFSVATCGAACWSCSKVRKNIWQMFVSRYINADCRNSTEPNYQTHSRCFFVGKCYKGKINEENEPLDYSAV